MAEQLIEEKHTCLDHLRRSRHAEIRSVACFTLVFDVHLWKLVYGRPEFLLDVTNAVESSVSIGVVSCSWILPSNVQQCRIHYLEVSRYDQLH